MIEFFNQYKFLVVPFLLWFGIQTFKVLYEYFKEGKWNIKRFMGAGGMPSSHSAVVVSLAALVGKYIGISSPIFALSALFAFITMYDAAGVRRAAGEQAKALNKLLDSWENQEPDFVRMELKEILGHTPAQVIAGALLGALIAVLLML